MGYFLLFLMALAAVGLPYCMLRAVRAIHEEDKDGREMFTALSCICAGVLAVFVIILILEL
ncbi:MAG: hypothetical protein J6J87_04765 [Oscillospiraceae bacterium]|nr:hypothetical protein [Oscillospiraceae bacterium]